MYKSVGLDSAPTVTTMPSKLLQYRTWLIAIFQAVLILTALVLAWLLRFDFALPDRALLFSAAPILVAIRLAAIGKVGLFHGWWRYTGMNDAVDVVKAIAIGSAGFLLLMRFFLGIVAFPRTVYIFEALLSLGLLVGVRFISRLLTESMSEMTATRRRVMLIGAGAAAQMVIREIKRLKNHL